MEDIASCPVCFEPYEENGDHVPRIFPCSHSLCQDCISIYIKNEKITCPECRNSWDARDGVKSFPLNRYILNQNNVIRQKEGKTGKVP